MANLLLRNISKQYPGGITAVADISVDIKDRELVVLSGPSGCGKSVLLRIIAGLEGASEGKIYIDDILVNDVPAKNRNLALILGNFALYPHMSIFDNMAFGLRMESLPPETIRKRVLEAADILAIPHLLDRKPKALSTAQRLRVSLGRAIVRKPRIFLFDDSFSALDLKLRTQTRSDFVRLHRALGTTFLYATRSSEEALGIGGRVIIMKEGRIFQTATPDELLANPPDLFSVGYPDSLHMNYLDATILRDGDDMLLAAGDQAQARLLRLSEEQAAAAKPLIGAPVILGIRPQDVVASCDPAAQGAVSFDASVLHAEPVEDGVRVALRAFDQTLTAIVPHTALPAAGEALSAAIRADRIALFDRETGRNILYR